VGCWSSPTSYPTATAAAQPSPCCVSAIVPADLGAVLTAHRLAVIGNDHTHWFRLPDVQAIAARKPPQPQVIANLPTQRQRPRFAT
jgi:hypothetical protein